MYRRTEGGLNSKLHAVCDGQGRPLVMLLTEGQTSDYKGAALMLSDLPAAKVSRPRFWSPQGKSHLQRVGKAAEVTQQRSPVGLRRRRPLTSARGT